MTSNLEVVRAYTREIGIGGDIEVAAGYFSDDFQNLDTDGNVALTKESWLGMARMMEAAFTDYGFVVTDLREEGDAFIMSGHIEGTFTSDLDLSAAGVGVIPASGKRVVWPDSSAKITAEGGKIVRMEPYSGGAGMKAFLGVLGVELPGKTTNN